MAFPSVTSRSAPAGTSANATSVACTMPSGSNGSLLAVVTSDGVPTLTTASTGWVKLGQLNESTSGCTQAVFWAKDGSVATALTVSSTASEEFSYVIHRLSGNNLVAALSTGAQGTSTNADPPNLAITSARDVLWIATRGGDAQVQATAAPTNFSNLQTSTGPNANGCCTATAERQLNASSLNPGTFTSATEQWVSFTVAIWEGVSLGALDVSPDAVAEDATAGTTVGALTGTTSGSTLSMTNTASSRFALSGSNIVTGATALDYETATTHNVVVRETHWEGVNSPRDSTIAIDVTDVSEPIIFSFTGSPPAGFAVTQAGTTYGDVVSGFMETYAANTPRVENGYLILEPAATNLIPAGGYDWTNAAIWVNNHTGGPDAPAQPDPKGDNDATFWNAQDVDSYSRLVTALSVDLSSPYRLQLYARANGGGESGNWLAICGVDSIQGDVAIARVQVTTDHKLFDASYTTSGSGSPTLNVRMPTAEPKGGTNNAGSYIIYGAQVKKGSRALDTYVLPGATRAADVGVFTVANGTYDVELTFSGGGTQTISGQAVSGGSYSLNGSVPTASRITQVKFTAASGASPIEPTGVASSLAFGLPKVALKVAPTGLAPTAAFGSPRVGLKVAAVAIASTLGFGSPSVALKLQPAGIAPTAAFGAPKVQGPLAPVGIAPSLAWGTPKVALRLAPGGVAATPAFGTPRVSLRLAPSGIAPTAAFGAPRLGLGVRPAGIASTQRFGTPLLATRLTTPGIASTLIFGMPRVALRLSPSGLPSSAAFGSPRLGLGLRPAGVVPTITFGAPRIGLRVAPAGIGSTAAFGSPIIGPGQIVAPPGIASTARFGAARLSLQVRAGGVAPTAAFGAARVVLQLRPTGVAPASAFGRPAVALRLSPPGLAPTAAFGTPKMGLGIASVGVSPLARFGLPRVSLRLAVPGIPSGVRWGEPRVGLRLEPTPDRTLIVQPQNRALIVAEHVRSLVVAPQNRTLTVGRSA